MKKLLRPLKKLDSFVKSDTGNIVLATIAVFTVFQLAIINIITRDWSDLFWVLLIGGFFLLAFKTRRLLTLMNELIHIQKGYIEKLEGALEKANQNIKSLSEAVTKKSKKINQQGTQLGELRAELAKYNGKENKQGVDTESDSEPSAGSTASAAGE